MKQTARATTAIDAYTQASLEKKDAERRMDETRADAMGEVLTLTLAGHKAMSHDRALIIVKGTEVLDVHGTVKAIAAKLGYPDLTTRPAHEAFLETMAGTAGTKLQYTKRADSLRVI